FGDVRLGRKDFCGCEGPDWANAYLAIAGRLVAAFALSDAVRDDSSPTLSKLKDQGFHLMVLTGDHKMTAGLPDIPHLTNLSTTAKALNLKENAAMVGDGFNDLL